jgi:hypothetical protein
MALNFMPVLFRGFCIPIREDDFFSQKWLGSKSVYGYWPAASATRLLGVKKMRRKL